MADEVKVRKRGIVMRLARIFGVTVCVVVGIIVVAMCAIAWFLTPDVLTPFLRKEAEKYLDADVVLGRVELTVWRSFPHLVVDVDSLTVRSHAFDGLSADEAALLPAGSDTLMHIGSFHGSINVAALFSGTISLSGFHIGGPSRLNAVVYDRERSNFDIAYSSEDSIPKDSGPMFVPDIRIDRFEIADSLRISYFSLPDSLDLGLTIAKSPLVTAFDRGYRLELNAGMDMFLPPELRYKSLDIGLNGNVVWDYSRPEILELDDFTVGIGALKPRFGMVVDFTDGMVLQSFEAEMDGVAPSDVLSVLPESYCRSVGPIDTDMSAKLRAVLTAPYAVTDSTLPSFEVAFDIPECRIKYDNKYLLPAFAFNGSLNFPDGDVNRAVLKVDRLEAGAKWIGIKLNGRFSNLLADPLVDADVRADVDFSRLPDELKPMVPGSLSGKVDFDSKVRLRLSDLNVGKFHRILLEGRLGLNDMHFLAADSTLGLFAREAEFKLGSNTSFVSDTHRVDSLLTASIKVDTLSVKYEDIKIRMKGASVGAGCLNKPRGSDSTVVMPFGGVIKVESLSYLDSDSMTVRLGDVVWNAMLRRYEGRKDVPMLQIFGDMGRAFFTDRSNYMMLRNSHVDLTAHLRRRGKVSPRIKARYDSIMIHNPGISADSAASILRAEYAMRSRTDSVAYERVNLDLGNDAKRLLRRWDVGGHISAEQGGAFTPHFPIRNRISNFNVAFSTDSIVLRDIRYRAGQSDFVVSGAVRGINRAVMRGGALDVNLRVKSDTLNVNELVQAAYAGAAYSGSGVDMSMADGASVDYDGFERLADEAVETDTIGALLVPMNLRAKVQIDADNILYSDMLMRDFNGQLLVNDGAATLRNLSAKSDIGSARMTALYVAPNKNDMRFGVGLQLDGIKVKEFVDMIPAVDSLMPLLKSFEGVINADVVATSDIDSTMNIVIPSLDAAIKLSGNNLVLLDAETFKTVAKWLMFKDKKVSGNRIDDMNVEMIIKNSTVELFPFVFDFDRYRLAVMGSNDLNLNYKYHVSVLKSPLPFKFGINISGNADDMKIRLGGAKYKSGSTVERVAIVDTTRVNLLREIDRVFQRGARAARLGSLRIDASAPPAVVDVVPDDTISARDSLYFIKEGLIEAPMDSVVNSNKE